ncbi:MAG: dienelactone hydrolase family protein [Isosphaeraceae bacterium]|nr:dienelactone hydrolase family protein [Isosphaeraceae bacterium]
MRLRLIALLGVLLIAPPFLTRADEPALPGTKPLDWTGDLASRMVDGVDRFLLRKIEHSEEGRAKHWKRDTSSVERYNASIEPNRKHLAHILGVRDPRVPFDGPELIGTPSKPALVGRGEGFEVFTVRWPAFGDVTGEGLLLVPTKGKPVADVVAIPDADQTPEQLAGLVEGVPPVSQVARRLAESGCRVLVPSLIDRHMEKRSGRANLTSREFLYRSAFELGRHLVGYEVQKVLAAVDWFAREAGSGDANIGVFGYGEGGMLALYAAALDPRIDAACVSGYFDDRRKGWQQPIDRNVFGLLDEFGDAEIASMVAPRRLVIEASKGPELTLPSEGGAPATLASPKREDVQREVDRARQLVTRDLAKDLTLVTAGDGSGPFGSSGALEALLGAFKPQATLAPDRGTVQVMHAPGDPKARQARQMHEIDRHSQALLAASGYVRQDFFAKLDTTTPEAFAKGIEWYRDFFANEVVGRFDDPMLPANPRARQIYDEPKYKGYEVVLDVFPDVFAYGILLVPKDIKEGEKRPVVVCQHGLEGRPQDVADPKVESPYYHQFANRLAERGFVTFAPQNPYIFKDRFRTLQRKSNPLKKTLFSTIVPQHQQITDWLKSLPYVDGTRIGFYGLSYGGKSAMRIPPLVKNYALSICSADFNEWVWKNATSEPRAVMSYVWTPEYEIFEFDLGSTFNYSEMAALIAPRPFMVERGHFDGVAPDEEVGYEFAKVRFFYEAKLGLKDQCEIEWFVGPHEIHGVGTYAFLHKHLNWAKK